MPDVCHTPACYFIVCSPPRNDELSSATICKPDYGRTWAALPARMPVAKAMQLIKAGSSLSMHETAGRPLFQWQEKYGAFSIGISQKDITARYIRNQKKHHATVNFREEWKAILKRHGLPIDE